jgi:hypothetical protein
MGVVVDDNSGIMIVNNSDQCFGNRIGGNCDVEVCFMASVLKR